jgi:hypothetical protein
MRLKPSLLALQAHLGQQDVAGVALELPVVQGSTPNEPI